MARAATLLLPTLRMLRTLGLLGWMMFTSGWQTVVWGNVQAGSVSLTGMPRSFRVLVRFGMLLTIGLLALLLVSDLWRVASPLQPLLFFSDSLSGLYAPVVFAPVAIGLLVLAWSYLLCGALHTPPGIKVAALGLFALFDMGLASSLFGGMVFELRMLLLGLPTAFWSTTALFVHVVVWLALLGGVVVLRRRPAQLGVEFPLMLTAVGLLLLTSFAGAQFSNRGLQMSNVASTVQLTQTLQAIGLFLTPFFVIAGAEMAEFGITLARGATRAVSLSPRLHRGRGRVLWVASLLSFLAFRLASEWLVPWLAGDGTPWRWGAAAVMALLLVAWWALRERWPDSLPRWVVPSAGILLYTTLLIIQVISTVVLLAAVVLISLDLSGDWLINVVYRIFGGLAQSNEVFVSLVALAVGSVLWIRQRIGGRTVPAAAVYAWLFGLWLLWWSQTRPGAPLGALTFRYEHLSALATLVLLAFLLVLGVTRRLRPGALAFLTAAAVLSWVLEFQSLLSDPLSPLFGLLGAQALILSVSIFLNVMAAGDRFALNDTTPAFPRTSRAMLYFGFALLTVTTVNWLAAAHHTTAIGANEQITSNGFIAVGLPIAFWVMVTRHSNLLGKPHPQAEVVSGG
jgi:hypothetical protein